MPFSAHEAPDVIVDLGEGDLANLFRWQRDEPPAPYDPRLERIVLYSATEAPRGAAPSPWATLTAYEGPPENPGPRWYAAFDTAMAWHTQESALAVLTTCNALPPQGEPSLNEAMRQVENALRILMRTPSAQPDTATRDEARAHVIQGMYAAHEQRDASRTLAVWNQAQKAGSKQSPGNGQRPSGREEQTSV